MKQKICTILVLVTMLLSLCTALPVSAAANLIKNGDFEASGVNPLNWYLGGGTIENEFRLKSMEAHKAFPSPTAAQQFCMPIRPLHR